MLDDRDPGRYDVEPGAPPPGGNLEPTSPGALSGWLIGGLVGGWLLHPVWERIAGQPLVVGWAGPIALGIVAVVVSGTTWTTWRAVQVRHERLLPHQAVNRLALARACAYAGSLIGGIYLGYAVSWLHSDDHLQTQQEVRSLVAGIAGAVVVVAGLLLERACRVRKDPHEP